MHTSAAQNKPQYTPKKALKKAVKLLRRIFRPSTTGKVIITTPEKVEKVLVQCQEKESTMLHDISTLTTCSTLSAEEYENQLNELAELEITIKLFGTA